MVRKVLVGISMVMVLMGPLFLGNFTTRPVFAQTRPQPQVQMQCDGEQPRYNGSIQITGGQSEDKDEVEEATFLQSLAKIRAKDAETIALAANPGTTVVKTELDNENGVLVYSVELSNGLDVKVDAGNGQILHIETIDDEATEAVDMEDTQEQEAVEDEDK